MSVRDIDTKTTIPRDGLRYMTKIPGSAFPCTGLASTSTLMSCFKCGRHKLLSELLTKKILGRNQKVCAVNCQART